MFCLKRRKACFLIRERKIMARQQDQHKICPVEAAGSFDSPIRRFLQPPGKLLKPYITQGMFVLDVGSGPGYFTIEIARLLNGHGKVVAVDLQQGMLDKIALKISNSGLEDLIKLHRCKEDSMDLEGAFDFILAFYIVHEVPNHKKLFGELASLLKPSGRILLAEPKIHVPKKSYQHIVETACQHGFEIIDRPKIFFSRSVLLKKGGITEKITDSQKAW